jgi:hypothetical protein
VTVLGYGLGAMVVALLLQVVWVRWRQPANHARVIMVVFASCSLLGGVLLHQAAGAEWCEVARYLLLTGSLSVMYLIVYAAVEDDSPSMAMVYFAAQAGAEGRARGEFRQVLRDDLLFGERVAAMRREGWLEEEAGGALRLSRRGAIIGKFYTRMQHALRMDEGG